MATSTSTSTLGAAFAEALAAKDFERAAAVLHPEVDFRAQTPNKSWRATGPRQVVDEILREWFDDATEVNELVRVETDAFASCQRVGYRLRGRDAEGPYVVEQQAYFEERDGKISWMRVVCSGMRPPS